MGKRTKLIGSIDFDAIVDPDGFALWLQKKPLQWSIVIATRAALRVLPIDGPQLESLKPILARFRATALARYSAKYPNLALGNNYIASSTNALDDTLVINDTTSLASAAAVRTALGIALTRQTRSAASDVFVSAANAVSNSAKSASSARCADALLQSIVDDIELLDAGALFEAVMDASLWRTSSTATIEHNWRALSHRLMNHSPHWGVWIGWYNDLLAGTPISARDEAAFTDLAGLLPWDEGGDAVGMEIYRRIGMHDPDPIPVEGAPSPLTINRLPDGRIGIEPGPFSLPTVPLPFSINDHNNALAACRKRAEQLEKIASAPTFQGRREYAQMIADYAEWLPKTPGAGNILLADGEARALNKLFAADESILPAGFASKLAILLEDHIALRSFYPEVERHYTAVNTGRLIKPLPRDAVEAIQYVIRLQTPSVFAETVSPAVDEAAKVTPDIEPLSAELPSVDPTQPRPPRDPIADADPQKSRSYIIASAYNRIWALILKGKDSAQAIEGWQKTYELLKPYMKPILDILRQFQSGDGPSLPPTIGT